MRLLSASEIATFIPSALPAAESARAAAERALVAAFPAAEAAATASSYAFPISSNETFTLVFLPSTIW
ncbi:hypothetical protein GMD85_13770 [Parabacteroides merdae]|nr:hypothetical protein [Parabacteroides merdae]MTU83528.1 hypothetical protein [Parabacteroides merdae]